MKFKIFFAILLSFLLHSRVEAAPAFQGPLLLSQEKFGERLVQEIMHGDTVSVAPYFEDSVRPNLTRQTLEHIQGQINWLAKFLGDSLEQIASGTQPLDPAGKEKAFFREYRLALESNKRMPLLVVHLWFKDSLTHLAAGAFVKSFMDNGEKRVADEQSWTLDGKHVDINAVVLVQISDSAAMLALEVFDDYTARIDTTYARIKGKPLIRKAIEEGFLEKAKAQLEHRTLIEDIGVAFIRRDPHFGLMKLKFGIKARDYMTAEELKKSEQSKKPSKPPGKSGPGAKKTK